MEYHRSAARGLAGNRDPVETTYRLAPYECGEDMVSQRTRADCRAKCQSIDHVLYDRDRLTRAQGASMWKFGAGADTGGVTLRLAYFGTAPAPSALELDRPSSSGA